MKNLKLMALVAALASTTAFDANATFRSRVENPSNPTQNQAKFLNVTLPNGGGQRQLNAQQVSGIMQEAVDKWGLFTQEIKDLKTENSALKAAQQQMHKNVTEHVNHFLSENGINARFALDSQSGAKFKLLGDSDAPTTLKPDDYGMFSQPEQANSSFTFEDLVNAASNSDTPGKEEKQEEAIETGSGAPSEGVKQEEANIDDTDF